MNEHDLAHLKDAHQGQTCTIIGKGESLDRLTWSHIPRGPVICLNESVAHVEALHRPGTLADCSARPLYSQQQDGKKEAMREPKYAHLLLSQISKPWYPDYPRRSVFDRVRDLGLRRDAFSGLVAIELARWFGCTRILFLCFDACVNGSVYYPRKMGNMTYDAKNHWRFGLHCAAMRMQLKGIPADWRLPGAAAELQNNFGDVTVITPTGDRPQAFALCKKYLARQSVIPAQWIVIDDGKKPLPESMRDGTDYIRREPDASDQPHTLPVNLATALEQVRYDRVIVMEDDDWYSPYHVSVLLGLLRTVELAGQGETIYYHVGKRTWARNDNMRHASLCQTGFTRAAFSTVYHVCQLCAKAGHGFLDLQLWNHWRGSKSVISGDPALCVGLKGLPGRPGISSGHAAQGPAWRPDSGLEKLYGLIGPDADVYARWGE